MIRRLAVVALLVASFTVAACSDATAPESSNLCGTTQGSDTKC